MYEVILRILRFLPKRISMRKLKIVNIFFILLLFIGTMSCAVKKKSKVGLKLTLGGLTSLGAKQDGVLRNHQKMEDGSYRDTVVFSIIDHEWLSVKNGLVCKLEERK